jgi:hypothetical protein
MEESERCSAVVSAGHDMDVFEVRVRARGVANRLVAIIAGWFAITHFRDFRPDTASNARVTGPAQDLAGTTRAAASFSLGSEALRRRATDSMARAEQGRGVVQLSSLQTGGARTRSTQRGCGRAMLSRRQADRLHDSDQSTGRWEGRGESSRSIVCGSLVKRGITQ